VLRHLPKSTPNPNLLVGIDTSDDAGVYKLTDDLAIIQTVDFFTPIVDDPYMFGQIAAANALSDVYAMGGQPLTVLNIVGFPIKKLDKQILADILRGAGDKVAEAGATLMGGHSIDDNEPKFGLAVTGVIHPSKVLANNNAKPGDKLILTKPIGVGIQTTAIKKDLLTPDQVKRVETVMATLNKAAAEVLDRYSAHACTDITGFGLLGHTSEVAVGSQVGIIVDAASVPVLEGTMELAQQNIIPGGSKDNHKWISDRVTYADHISQEMQYILTDAVTSGGLLISISADQAEALLKDLHAAGVTDAAIIGEVVEGPKGHIEVR
jgi:selenide,water dikinase